MSSDRCEELLVGLAAGDLGGEQERAARAEIGRCAEHAAALRKLDVGMRFASMLPSVEPRPELDGAILAAARAKVAEAKAAPTKKKVVAPEAGLLSRALAVLRRLATGQQLAMSTVMLLVVAIGLWYLPARREPNASGDTVMAPPQLAEEMPRAPAPAAGPAPAEPARRGEARVAQAPAAPPGGPKPVPRSVPETSAARRARAPEEPAVAQRSASPRERRSQMDALARGAAEAEAPATRAPARADTNDGDGFGALAMEDSARSRASGRASVPPAAPAAPAAAAPSPVASASARESAAADEIAEEAPAAERGADREATSAGGSAYERAMAAYQAGRYAEAAQLFSTATSGPDAASALHYLGRSRRAAGQCAIAVHDYERLLRSFPSYGPRTQAMIEAADCYQRTGHLAAAEQWLERAAQASPSSVAARRELSRVRAMRAAPREGNPPARPEPESSAGAAESF